MEARHRSPMRMLQQSAAKDCNMRTELRQFWSVLAVSAKTATGDA
jgi:hypothetical protein